MLNDLKRDRNWKDFPQESTHASLQPESNLSDIQMPARFFSTAA